VKEDESLGCIFVFVYKNRILRPAEIVLRKGKEG
jgi:hypothetical protein